MLLSPPGYGKTTLVEYVASRLGMALLKVSGPGLGHEVTSLDPGQAPSATAAREIERINLAFAVGTNVILYLDDIANRADTYNLGDVLSGNEDVFARSYIENALTANPTLAPLAGRSAADLQLFFNAAEGSPLEESSLEHGYSSAESSEIVTVLGHLMRVQDVVLKVNRQYCQP